ncbi:hypothetical protein B0H17DRAFT_1052305 [Mycena rosella]|uniref:Uncharacterized protein n=1 Tax=Mycena rosella TaxID=1033263 RepID=A0AAD7DR64_MYCRO|nr:hypothetical protein B0H17DRAFT_1052305 [Mycena rosella]
MLFLGLALIDMFCALIGLLAVPSQNAGRVPGPDSSLQNNHGCGIEGSLTGENTCNIYRPTEIELFTDEMSMGCISEGSKEPSIH